MRSLFLAFMLLCALSLPAMAQNTGNPVHPLPFVWHAMNGDQFIQVDRVEVTKGMMTIWYSRPTSGVATRSFNLGEVHYMTSDYSRYSPLTVGGRLFTPMQMVGDGEKSWVKYPVPPGNPPVITLDAANFDMADIPVSYK